MTYVTLRESHRPGIEPATCKSQVQRPTAEPPRNTILSVSSVNVGLTDNDGDDGDDDDDEGGGDGKGGDVCLCVFRQSASVTCQTAAPSTVTFKCPCKTVKRTHRWAAPNKDSC